MLVTASAGRPSIANAGEDAAISASAARAPVGYRAEVEPHVLFATAPPGIGQGSGLGAGVRSSVVILRNGLIPKVDDSIAIGFGLDYGRYYGKWALNGYSDFCLHYEAAPNGTRVCTDVTSKGGTYTYVYVPAAIQWNLRPTHRVSALFEPGVDVYHLDGHGWSVVPALSVGARLKVSDRTALTGRVG